MFGSIKSILLLHGWFVDVAAVRRQQQRQELMPSPLAGAEAGGGGSAIESPVSTLRLRAAGRNNVGVILGEAMLLLGSFIVELLGDCITTFSKCRGSDSSCGICRGVLGDLITSIGVRGVPLEGYPPLLLGYPLGGVVAVPPMALLLYLAEAENCGSSSFKSKVCRSTVHADIRRSVENE